MSDARWKLLDEMLDGLTGEFVFQLFVNWLGLQIIDDDFFDFVCEEVGYDKWKDVE